MQASVQHCSRPFQHGQSPRECDCYLLDSFNTRKTHCTCHCEGTAESCGCTCPLCLDPRGLELGRRTTAPCQHAARRIRGDYYWCEECGALALLPALNDEPKWTLPQRAHRHRENLKSLLNLDTRDSETPSHVVSARMLELLERIADATESTHHLLEGPLETFTKDR